MDSSKDKADIRNHGRKLEKLTPVDILQTLRGRIPPTTNETIGSNETMVNALRVLLLEAELKAAHRSGLLIKGHWRNLLREAKRRPELRFFEDLYLTPEEREEFKKFIDAK